VHLRGAIGLRRAHERKVRLDRPKLVLEQPGALPTQGKPSDAGADGLLDGLDCVNARAHILMAAAQRRAAAE